jgi:hypothetical protein
VVQVRAAAAVVQASVQVVTALYRVPQLQQQLTRAAVVAAAEQAFLQAVAAVAA